MTLWAGLAILAATVHVATGAVAHDGPHHSAGRRAGQFRREGGDRESSPNSAMNPDATAYRATSNASTPPPPAAPFLERVSIRREFLHARRDSGSAGASPPGQPGGGPRGDRLHRESGTRGATGVGRGNPWGPALELQGAEQLLMRADGTVWLRETATGSVWLVDVTDGTVSVVGAVTVGGSPLVVSSHGRIVTSDLGHAADTPATRATPSSTAVDSDTLIVVEPTGIRWLACRPLVGGCEEEGAAAGTAPGEVLSAAASGDHLWIGTTKGLWHSDSVGSAPRAVANVTAAAVRAIALAGPFVAVATVETLYWRDTEDAAVRRWSFLGVGGVIDPNITTLCFLPPALASAPAARPPLAIGTTHAVHILGDTGVVQRFSGLQGLPAGHATVLANSPSANASLWIGTPDGLVEMASDRDAPWRYYSGDRWLVANETSQRSAVVAITVGPPRVGSSGDVEQVVWVSTTAGLAAISLTRITLEDKMAHYQTMVSPRHDRWGWVAQVPLAAYGVAAAAVPTDGDNDGSNTAYYMASQIFRYQVTKEPEALALSWKAFRALEFLHNVTHPFSKTPGYIARTAVRCGEPHQGPSGGVCNTGCHCAPAANTSCPGCSPPAGSCTGCACPGWKNSTVCYAGVDTDPTDCCWSFKSDTSTDETDGHFYGLHIAYDDLAQTEPEKVRVARLICNAASYIVDGGFNFIDPLTGNRTTWGYWSPDILNGVGVGSSNGVGDNGKPNERGLNSLEMLSYIAVALKVCSAHPDASPPLRHPAKMTYGGAMTHLLDNGYGENLLNVHLTNPGYDNQGIAWFDFSNAFYTYYSFAKAAPWGTASKPPAGVSSEALETLRAQFFAGFEAYWGARSYNARDEHDGLYSVIYTAVTGNPGHIDPLWVVRRGPHELIAWPVSNSRRLDIELRKEELECCDAKMAVMPLPPDESPDARFEDDSPYPLDGGSGYYESPPTLYLETYWMARFHGVAL